MTRPFFSIDTQHIANLSPEDAVKFFRSLLCAHAHRIGIPSTNINISERTNVADGGVDADIIAPDSVPSFGLISSRHTCFQIKTGDSFSPWQPAAIKEELFGGREERKENLKPAVRSYIDKQGKYTLICFGCDLTNEQRNSSIQLLKNHFLSCGYENPQVDVYSQNQIKSLIEEFPALVRQLNPYLPTEMRSHSKWAIEREMVRSFKIDQKQNEFINKLQQALRNKDTRPIRVCGEAGIGKTRLVLEATRSEDLAPLVLYCSSIQKIGMGVLQALEDDPRLNAILVVDECDPDGRAQLADRFAAHAKRIQIITIYQDDDNANGLNLLFAPVLDETVIANIISSYGGVLLDHANSWADLCDGSPRVAHVIGENLILNPEDVLKPPSTNNIWERFICGNKLPSDPQVRQTRTVLRYLSLFKRFGFDPPVNEEAEAIAAMIHNADNSITLDKFREIVHDLRQRKILQGERTLYITPKALHIWLWLDYWNIHGLGFHIDEFSNKLKGKLINWFIDMWRYAHRSQAATKVVEQLLGANGPFADSTLLRTELGSDFFLALTDASPESAIKCLERTVGAWTHEQLLEFKTGRRNIIHALERMAIWRSLFTRSARILLKLAAAENETWANNATGLFIGLFTPGYGYVATSEASPQERFPVLQEALTSKNTTIRSIGIKAANAALEASHFSRVIGAEYQGLRMPPKLWTPKTYGELFESYRQVWQFLERMLMDIDEAGRIEIINVLLQRSRELIQIRPFNKEFLQTIISIAKKKLISSNRVINACEDILRYSDITPEIRATISDLINQLIGTSFSGRLHRYIGLRRLEDNFEEGKRTNRWENTFHELVEEAIQQPELLKTEIDWLLSPEAQNAGQFGYYLGKRDQSLLFKEDIFQAILNDQKQKSVLFYGGYLAGIFENDQAVWETELDRWAANVELAQYVPELTWRSGITERAAQRILKLMEDGVIKSSHISFFRFGQNIEKIPEPLFEKIIIQLLKEPTEDAAALALELVYDFYARTKRDIKLDLNLAMLVLSEPRLFQIKDRRGSNSILDYTWLQLASAVLKQDNKLNIKILDLILDANENLYSFLDYYNNDLPKLIRTIVSNAPEESWSVIEKRLRKDDQKALKTIQWISGHNSVEERPGIWELIPSQSLWKWVDEKPDKRIWMIAHAAPRTLDLSANGRITRELLIRYGDREDIKNVLIGHFWSGIWHGTTSNRYREMKKTAEKWLSTESEPHIREWLYYYIEYLDKEIENSLTNEERNEF